MNTFISPALDTADLLALAWPEDDGAPPAVSPPPSADAPGSNAIRVARTGHPAASQTGSTGRRAARQALQGHPPGWGAGLALPVSPEPRRSRTGFEAGQAFDPLLEEVGCRLR